MAVYTVDVGPMLAQAECDCCGWRSAPAPETVAHQWAASHHTSCESPSRPVVSVRAASVVQRSA
jgi:hypothetical protein